MIRLTAEFPFLTSIFLTSLLGSPNATGNELRLDSVPQLGLFSDKEESAPSETTIRMTRGGHGSIVLDYSIPPNPQLGYEYAGISFVLTRNDISAYRSLIFDVRSDGKSDISTLQAVTSGKKRNDIAFSRFGRTVKEWRTYSISLAEFEGISSDAWANMNRFAFLFSKPGGRIQLSNVRLSDAVTPVTSIFNPRFATIMKPIRRSVPKATMAWIYDLDSYEPEDVRPFMARNGRRPILLTYAGSVDDRFISRQPDMDKMKKWVSAGFEIHAMIDGSNGEEFSKAADLEYESVAKLIAGFLKKNPVFKGVHFDIEPHMAKHSLLIALVRNEVPDLLVSAAVGRWDSHLMGVCDFVVLMGYDLKSTPSAFTGKARQLYSDFAKDCENSSTPFFIGVPAIATHMEYESMGQIGQIDMKDSGYQMEDFLKPALEVAASSNTAGLSFYRGISIWALLDEPVGAPGGKAICPFRLKPAVVNLLDSHLNR